MASQRRAPDFPAMTAAFQAAPIVTTLLAAIAAAVLVAPLASEKFRSADVIPWSGYWPTRDAVLVAATGAIVSLVASTVAMIYAQAKDVDTLSPERQKEVIPQQDFEIHIDGEKRP